MGFNVDLYGSLTKAFTPDRTNNSCEDVGRWYLGEIVDGDMAHGSWLMDDRWKPKAQG